MLVRGRVQGVGFRWHTRDRAQALALHGWVANLDDGRVEVSITGDAASVDQMLAWLRRGPASAHVEALAIDREPDAAVIAAPERRVSF